MPPSVACALVDTSTGIPEARASSAARSGGPARCRARPSAVRCSASTSSTLRTCLEKSITRPAPTVWPHWLVPPPRGTIGTFRSRQMSSAMRDVLGRARHEHADRHDLVDRRVGGVAAAVGRRRTAPRPAFRRPGAAASRPATSLLARGDGVVGLAGGFARDLQGQGRVHARRSRRRLRRLRAAAPARRRACCAGAPAAPRASPRRRARARASIICSCSFTARFHFSPSWLERKRSACRRALTWL